MSETYRPNPERREGQEDLELGKAHLQDIYERASRLMRHDPEKNTIAAEAIADLDKVNSAIELKARYALLQQQLENMDRRGRPEEDRAEANRILIELASMEKRHGAAELETT